MKEALARGKGAIVLGAHYGPVLCTYMLDRLHFDVKTLVDKRLVTHLHNAGTLVLKPLRSKKIQFLNESGVVLVSREEEKYLFDHVKKGGMVKMDIDYPGPPRNAGTAPFLGISITPHLFPFRLALKYDIPVFFCFFNKNRYGAYIMNFIPSGEYSTPEEGFRRYLFRLQTQIEEYPFMWFMIPQFFKWSNTEKIKPSDENELSATV
jgi:lauroyl/myristoyl acyltransferase